MKASIQCRAVLLSELEGRESVKLFADLLNRVEHSVLSTLLYLSASF
jgi:hypothetical protein